MRMIAIFLMILPLATVWAEEVDLPSSTDRVISKYDKAVEKARDAYLKAITEAKEDLADSMADEIEKVTKKGDLQTALAIQEKAGEMAAAAPEGYLAVAVDGDSVDLMKKPKSNAEIIATNTWVSGTWTDSFNPDGSVMINGSKSAKTWEVDGDTIVVKVNGAIEQVWSLQEDGTVHMTRTNGGPMTWTMVK